ncbi:universal stress protein [Arthrobacter sp. 92]|uniref:universal stress protein n=1 Tax=Arthrobacter sp. 92 TaxID=3418175 RepID=UPI003D01666A
MPAPADGRQGSAIAVGYDGSEPSQLAVRWAAGHAVATGRSLRVVHAWVWPMFTKNLGPVKGVQGSGLRHAAEVILAEGVAAARAVSNELDVEGSIEAGLPAQVLREASQDAALLVVGHRGMGRLLGQLVGSACLDLAVTARCPLMVIRYPGRPGLPVAAGIDSSARCEAVVADAATLAVALRVPLQLIHVDPGHHGEHDHEPHGRHAPLHGQELLDHTVDLARRLSPGLEVDGTLVEGHPASKELLTAAAHADVLVLGAHHREGHPGSTVSAALERALCNVMITR